MGIWGIGDDDSWAHRDRRQTTVALIHDALVSGLYWNLMIPHLPSYHFLVPDRPGHGKSQAIAPLSVDLAARLIAQLIRTHAINGLAHIVGHSLGAQVAIRLACTPHSVPTGQLRFCLGFWNVPSKLNHTVHSLRGMGDATREEPPCLPPDLLGNGWCRYSAHRYRCLHTGPVSPGSATVCRDC
ncbi:Alpha/beta hydrolase fold-1 [Penicillium paradoxum]|uniref:Alpha/beta hydrolase fold-1 n=1 Tax=Penicillium paradoxum TaxID=176176 RepID=UPI002548D44C|nr:Alpha/beta hydrolase fold-1 [Penicillium paradoxum]KAJ5778869.1 Alpha/beta hydrolase fold-1 [Penicillium paradoxum]